ncbi:MAG: 16S rRNA (guanine(527)-N(7))-methyltransferase RsmG [Brevinema sp.]
MDIQDYIRELLYWNKTHNLISKKEISNLEEHIQDSLSLYEHILKSQYKKVIDIGSGGGFPIIPLAFWSRQENLDINFTATDIVEKKLSFLRWCNAKFTLNMIIENLNGKIVLEQKALIISRAFSSIKNILSWRNTHAPLCKEFYLLKGHSVLEELEEANIASYELINNPRGFIVKFINNPNEEQ